MLVSSMLLAGCGSKEPQRELNIYSYGPLVPQEVLDDFTATTGIKVNVKEAANDEEIYETLKSNGGSEYDIAMVDDYILEPIIADDLALKLDTSKIENYKNINPVYQGQYFDPENEYTIPYGAGIQTIIYNTDLVDFEIKGFDDLLNPALKDSIGMVDNMIIMMGLSLISNGESVSSEDMNAIDAAGEKLVKMAPNVHAIEASKLDESLISEETSVGLMYTYEINNVLAAAKEQGMNFKVVYPQEGIGFGTVVSFAPKNAPHQEELYEFFNYILDPEVAKICTEMVGYSTNKETDKLYDEEMKLTRTLPEDLDTSKMQVMENFSAEAMNRRSEWWIQFKNACGK